MVPPTTFTYRIDTDDLVPWVSLLCTPCDVKWRGRPEAPCWACGERGTRGAQVTTVID